MTPVDPARHDHVDAGSLRAAVAATATGSRSRHQQGRADAVDADVEQRAGATRVEAVIATAHVHRVAERRRDRDCNVPSDDRRASVQHDLAGLRMMRPHVRLEHRQPRGLGVVEHLRSLSASDSVSGFSHSTCLPASSAAGIHSRVQVVGQRDVDRVDVGAGSISSYGATDRRPSAGSARR